KPKLLPDRLELVEELFFAVEAAGRVVAGVCGQLDRVSRDLEQTSAERARQDARLLLLRFRVGGRACEHRRGLVAELIQGELEQERRIDSARIGDQDGSE